MAQKNDTHVRDTILRFAQDLGRQTEAVFLEHLDELPSNTGTPIEQLMGAALTFALRSHEWFGGEGWGEGDGWPILNVDAADVFNIKPTQEGVMIWHQVPVGKYRADFVVCLAEWRGGYVWGAIECDGHDHHNLTKEQAEHDRKRDRFFQSKGLIILRYTGSEIWKAPLKCAVDAITILQDRAKDPSAARYRDAPSYG